MDIVIFAVICLLIYFYTVTCTFFAAEIAGLKGRRRGWGWLGLIFGILGVIVVCFLPNAKGVVDETNPVKAIWRKLTTTVSSFAAWIIVIGLVLVVGGTFFGSRLTTYLENRVHEKELSETVPEEEVLTPATVSGKVASVFCGAGSNFAVTEKGDLYGWGKVGLKALDESGKIYEKVKKVCKAGDTYYLLTTDGTLYGKGNNKNALLPGQKEETVESFVKLESDVKDVDLSATVGAILKKSGNLYVVGVNTYGQLGRAALRAEKTEHIMAKDVKKVVVTGRSVYYMKENGIVCGVGNNAYGQFGLGHNKPQGVPVKLADDGIDIAAGEDFFLVLKKDGSVFSAGNNCYGQLGREPGDGNLPDGATEEDKKNVAVPTDVLGRIKYLENVTRIEAAGGTAFAVATKELYGWGRNHLGQFGDGEGNREIPELLRDDLADLSVSSVCTLVLTDDGELLGAGDRQNYQLGSRNDDEGFRKIAEVKE